MRSVERWKKKISAASHMNTQATTSIISRKTDYAALFVRISAKAKVRAARKVIVTV